MDRADGEALRYRRDYRARVRTLLPLPFFVGAGVRIYLSGGATEVERALLGGLATGYLMMVVAVWVRERMREVVTSELTLLRHGRAARRGDLSHLLWREVTELRERYRARTWWRGPGGAVELTTPKGGLLCDAGWRPYGELVRECAERTTESILAGLEDKRAAGVVLSFGDVQVEGDTLLFPLARGGLRRVRIVEVTGLRLYQGVLVFYLEDGRYVLRRLEKLVNPYALMELVLRAGAGRNPGPPPDAADLPPDLPTDLDV